MPILALAFLAGAACVFGLERLPGLPALAALAGCAAVAWALGARPVACGVAGFLLAAGQGHLALAQDWPCARDREQVPIEGRVVSPPEPRPGRVDFDFAPGRAGRRQGVPPRVRLSWYEPNAQPAPGERWRLEARLRCRNGLVNPGGSDRELALLRSGLGATGYIAGPAPQRLGGGPLAAPVSWLRSRIAGRIATAAAGTRSTGVLQGLAVGLRGNIAPELNDAFVATGTAHLIAISGMHVTAFALAAHLLLRLGYRLSGRPAWSARWPAAQALAVVGVTAAYGLLAGASLPTVRTVAMVAVALALRAARRRVPVADLLCAAAVLLVVLDPLAVTSAGFWLSFAAVAALLGLVELRASPLSWARAFVRAQAAVTAVLAPVLLGAFGAVSLVGPLVNAVAIPLFSFVVLPLTLGGIALMPLSAALADSLWQEFGGLLDRLWPWLLAAGQGEHAMFSPPAAPGWLIGATLGVTLAAVVLPVRALRALAAVLLCASLLRPAQAPAPGGFELTVLDVGHGLAAVVRTATHALVFDTGPLWQGGGSAARVSLVPYLRWLGVRRVDLLVVSHPDRDHAGGVEDLLRNVAVRQVMGDAGARTRSKRCQAGETWSWDDVEFTVVHPAAGESREGNDGSCALRIGGAGGTALLLADPEHRAERAMLMRPIAADVVLVPHHGSRSSSSTALVAAVGASTALVSAGYGNRWGLPREEIVERWRAAGAQVETTAAGGALRVDFVPGVGPGPVRAHRSAVRRWWRR